MDIPQLGYGTFLATDPTKLKAALHYAIEECGVRNLDCAWGYNNQDVIGDTLKEIFDKGKIKREDIFITSKLWCTHHRPDLVEYELKETLQQLQLDYIDLWLMHMPIALQSRTDREYFPKDSNGKVIYEQIDILDTYKAMEECMKKGMTRHIGVSNFSIEQLERVWFNCDIKPYANQVECHVYKQHHPLIDYCESHNIFLMAHTTIGHPPLKGYRSCTLIEDPDVVSIANEIGKTPAQVCIKFLIQMSPKVIAIPMSLNPTNIKLNYDMNFILNDSQMSKLKSLDRFYAFKYYPDVFGVDVLGYGFNVWA